MKEFIEKLIGRLEESQERYDDVSFAQLNEFGHTLDYEYAKGKRDGVEESIEIVNQLAEEYKTCYKSCTECEAYDKEKHHCPKFCYIIAETVKEIEENQNVWIPTSERLPEKNAIVLTCDKDGWISVKVNMPYAGVKNDFECGYYTAWMPLPEPFTPKEGRE